jgi:hypothetical protein
VTASTRDRKAVGVDLLDKVNFAGFMGVLLVRSGHLARPGAEGATPFGGID